ncbi:MAG: NAD(P)/FAD-dependent oxidoreductase [Ignavibacteriaceae bacterium]
MKQEKVVIIGGGFGGLSAAKVLKNSPFDITIVDKTNHHLFQPLLYQVATAALSPGDIATPIRAIFSNYKNIKVVMDEAQSVDIKNKTVVLKDSMLEYDYLIIATGSKHSYFGNNRWEKFAPGLKTLNDALRIREKILFSLEKAEKIGDPAEAGKYLTFVIVGGGPTGVELAGAIAEIARETIMKDYRSFTPGDTDVYLIEALPKILSSYSDDLSSRAKIDLEKLGVKILLGKKVTDIDENGVHLNGLFIESANVIWAAGNEASPLLKSLNTELDRAGRVIVNKDLSINSDRNIFVIGDAAAFKDETGNWLPGVAQVAMQQGRFAAKIIKNQIEPDKRPVFRYSDYGSMATIGRAKAVAVIKGLKLKGLPAWLSWCFIHILQLIGFRNRIRVMAEWMWYYITRRNGIRLIVGKNGKE